MVPVHRARPSAGSPAGWRVRCRPVKFVPRCEPLEGRLVPSLVVTTTADAPTPGALTLRDAITAADNGGGTITFAIPTSDPGYSPATGVATIQLTSALPSVTANVTIDATGVLTPAGTPGLAVSGANQYQPFHVVAGGTLTLSGLIVENGLAANGGAVQNDNSLYLSRCLFLNNHATGNGGAVENTNFAQATGCTFQNNTAAGSGGALDNVNYLALAACTLAGNTAAAGDGGAVANADALALVNCTLQGNQAPQGRGGAVLSSNFTQAVACTIAGNAAASGGGLYNNANRVQLTNTILAGNTAGAGADLYSYSALPNLAALTSSTHCLIGSVATNDATSLSDLGGNLFGVNPGLGPLQANGGPTPTMAPLPGSPALGAGLANPTDPVTGTAVTTDQRGAARSPTAPAIGAFEGCQQAAAVPAASLGGPSTGLVGQRLTFTLGACEAGLPAGTSFTFDVSWGDGTADTVVSGPSGTTVTHVYARPGAAYAVRLTATDPGQVAGAPAAQACSVLPMSPANLQRVVGAAPGGTFTFQAGPADVGPLVQALNGLPKGSTATVQLNLSDGAYGAQALNPPAGVTVILQGGAGAVFQGKGPALTVASGNVVVNGLTLTTRTNSPTVLLTGGSLTLRNATVQANGSQAALRITGGTADLGTSSDPGGNTLAAGGTGLFLDNAGPGTVRAVGNTFTLNGQALHTSSLTDDLIIAGHIRDALDGAGGLVVFVDVSQLAGLWGGRH